MANGDCPVGAANAANIRTLEREMAETRDEVHEVKGTLQDLQVRRARIDGWSALIIGLVAAAASILGPWLVAIAQAKQ